MRGTEHSHLTTVLDAIADGIVEFDPTTGTCVVVNRSFCELVGYTLDEIRAARAPAPWIPEREWHRTEHALSRLAEGRPVRYRTLLRHRDGTEFPALVTGTPVSAEGGDRVIAVVHDQREDERVNAELADARALVRVADERDRIARELHDRVIQRLFAAGLHLEAAVGRSDVEERMMQVVDEIDTAITEIRSSIFTLHRPRDLRGGLEAALRTCATDAVRLLGHHPVVAVSGTTGDLPDDLVEEVATIARELLSNVAQHAGATASWLTVTVHDGWLTLSVEDDGLGIRPLPRSDGEGIRNVIERAERRAGRAVVADREPSGTIVTWAVPMAATPADAQTEPSSGPSSPSS